MQSFWPALISKGLRPQHVALADCVVFLACPDFKGIKTVKVPLTSVLFRFLACPDFKGIKTQLAIEYGDKFGFWPALISKGLRLNARVEVF